MIKQIKKELWSGEIDNRNESEHENLLNQSVRSEDLYQELSRKRQVSHSNGSAIEALNESEPTTSRRRLTSRSNSITESQNINHGPNPQNTALPQSSSIRNWLKPLDLSHSKGQFRKSCNGNIEIKCFDDEYLIRWRIFDFCKRFTLAENRSFFSEVFFVKIHPSIKFQMFFEPNFDLPWEENKYGICVKNIDKNQLIEVGEVDIWLENNDGDEFGENASEHFFNLEFNAFRSYMQSDDENDIKLMKDVWDERKDLTIYCKLVGLKFFTSFGSLSEIGTKPFFDEKVVDPKLQNEKENILKADYHDNACFLRWQLNDFQYQFKKAKDEEFRSETFSIDSHPSMKFALFYKRKSKILWHKNRYGIVLKDFGNCGSVEFDIDFWLENESGKKFGFDPTKNYVFDELEGGLESNIGQKKDNHGFLINAWRKRKDIFVCCRINESKKHSTDDVSNTHELSVNCDSNVPAIIDNFVDLPTSSSSNEHNLYDLPSTSIDTTNTSTVQIDKEFLDDIWASYERGEHDSIIKVGDTEFKVMKHYFTCHSPVFKDLFECNEDIELTDISVNLMKCLIKYMYVGEIEDISKVYSLFIVAKNYGIASLKNTCLKHLPNALNIDNVLFALVVAIIQNDNDLKSKALKLVGQMSKKQLFESIFKPEWELFKRRNSEIVDEVKESISQYL